MKLKKLLKNFPEIQVKGSKDVEINGLSSNSKLITPGNLFIAKKGKSDDGVFYIPEAVQAGASAILTDIYDPSLKNVVQLIHPDVVGIEASLVAEYYQHPSHELFVVGITGTSGKTTTSFLIKYLLDLDETCHPCGLIGTIEYIVGSYRYQASRTTPDVISNHKMLREMLNQGCRSAVMEVTSHALDQGRVAHIDFDVAIFSNLTHEHLDYHHTMENYCHSKNRLFRDLGAQSSNKGRPKYAIVNADSPWLSQVIAGCKANQITYGIENQADLRASNIRLGQIGTEATVTYQGQTMACQWPLIGRFNVYNCLSAMGVALSQGMSLEEVVHKMQMLPSVKGRLQPVINDLGLKIYVDYAHKYDALLNVLQTLNELKNGRIITVFGCGGDRDRGKRPKMAEVSEQYSDLSIVTLDNPRSENPESICKEIITGFKRKDSYIIELDRRSAIQKAIELATEKDIVLIAGKGHEAYQVFAHHTIEFDDHKVASEICHQLVGSLRHAPSNIR